MKVAEPPPTLPTGAYVTVGLLIGLAALLSWLIASYPSNPSQRPIADDCEAIAQQYSQTDRGKKAAADQPTTLQNDQTAPYDTATDKTKGEVNAERQIAKYNSQLAIYTRDLAHFTKWLVYATTGLIAIGLLQGFFLQKNVHVADRAATEARDAITAAQTAANAANTQALAAQEANRINREVLISANRPWIALEMTTAKDELLIFTDKHIEISVTINITNIGRSPAMRVIGTVWIFPSTIEAGRAIDDIRIQAIPPARQMSGHGRLLFPEQAHSEKLLVRLPIEDFRNSIESLNQEWPLNDEGRPAVIAIAWWRFAKAYRDNK